MLFHIDCCSMEDIENLNIKCITKIDNEHYINVPNIESLLDLLENSYSNAPDFGGLFLSKSKNGFEITVRDFYFE